MTSSSITVVIPLFNKQSFIRRCLESIAAQSVLPDEVIVVDDGSTDDGPMIVASFEWLPIRLIRQENAGVSMTRNRGIQEAQGSWIAFLDADDEYLPDAIEAFRNARDEHPEACVVFGKSVHGPATWTSLPSTRRYVLVSDYFAYLLERGAHEVNSSSVMVRKSAIQEAGLFPPGIRIGEDTDTWMRLGCLFDFVRIDAPVAVYHIEDGDSGWQTERGAVPFWYGTYERWREVGRISELRRASAARYFEFSKLQMVIFLARTSRRKTAFRWMFGHVRWGVAPKVKLAKTLLIAFMPSILDWGRR